MFPAPPPEDRIVNVARMTACTCGHAGIEHYDSHGPCLASASATEEFACNCQDFEPAEAEVYVSVSSPWGV